MWLTIETVIKLLAIALLSNPSVIPNQRASYYLPAQLLALHSLQREKCWFPGNFSNCDVCKWMLWLLYYSKNITETTVLLICKKPDLRKSWVFLDLVLLITKSWEYTMTHKTRQHLAKSCPNISVWCLVVLVSKESCRYRLSLYFTFPPKWFWKPWSFLWAPDSRVCEALM